MPPTEIFPQPQEDAEYFINTLKECDAGIHPAGNGITDTRGNFVFLSKKLLEDRDDEIAKETREGLIAAAGLRVTRRGKIRY